MTDDDEFLSDVPDERFVEPDGTESDASPEQSPEPNFNAVGPGDVMALMELEQHLAESDPILPARTVQTKLIEDVEPEACLMPPRMPMPEPPPPVPVELIPPERERGTSMVGAFFLVAFLLTWATLD